MPLFTVTSTHLWLAGAIGVQMVLASSLIGCGGSMERLGDNPKDKIAACIVLALIALLTVGGRSIP